MDVQDRRRELGAFYTPRGTARFMASLLRLRPTDEILDPCAGGGAFIEALLERGVGPDRITAWELDPAACARLRTSFPGVRVERRDALLADAGAASFDAVIANPPYLNKASGYVRSNRTELRRRYGGTVGSGETFAMFLYRCLTLLAPGGRLAFLVSDTIRTLGTHERLRALILERFHLHTLAATPPRLFPDATVRTAVVGIDRCGGDHVAVLPEAQDGSDHASARWRRVPLDAMRRVDGHPFLLEDIPSVLAMFGQERRLRDLVDGHIGMHTRDNRRHLAAVAGTPLAAAYARRRRRPDEHRVIAPDAAGAGWVPYLKEGGGKDFWFPIVELLDWSPDERRGYVVPHGGLFGRAGIAVSGVSRRLSARLMPAGCYWDTNKVIGLVPRDAADTMFLLGVLNSDLFTYLAKRVLNASSSLQIRDLRRLPVPPLDPSRRAQIAGLAERCVELVRGDQDADIDEPRAALDEAVFGAFAITAEDREEVRRAVAPLNPRRTVRAGSSRR